MSARNAPYPAQHGPLLDAQIGAALADAVRAQHPDPLRHNADTLDRAASAHGNPSREHAGSPRDVRAEIPSTADAVPDEANQSTPALEPPEETES